MIALKPPLDGITNGGWRLVYNETANGQTKISEQLRKYTDLSYSLGLLVKEDGSISDVNPEMAAAKAGIAPGMKLIAVNNRKYSSDALHEALAAGKNNSKPLEFLVENGSFHQTYNLDYHNGERYPHLERDATKPDVLSEVTKPRGKYPSAQRGGQ